MIKFLKYVSTPIDVVINKVTNGRIENVIWGTLTRYECKTKGMRVKATLRYSDKIVTGLYFCGWLLTDDDMLIHISPAKFLKENFQEKLDK
jgi:hypothetical protein